jgi:hypothetical protein
VSLVSLCKGLLLLEINAFRQWPFYGDPHIIFCVKTAPPCVVCTVSPGVSAKLSLAAGRGLVLNSRYKFLNKVFCKEINALLCKGLLVLLLTHCIQ